MIQFNLLPDVKLEYIKAKRTKHLIMLASFVVTGISVALVVLLFIGVNVAQKGHLNRLDEDIKSKTTQLQNEGEIDKILTIQNQLNTLNGLHDSKPAAERLSAYLEQVTPAQVTISQIVTDFTTNTMTIDGDARDLKSVNEFIDTLKFTDYEEEVKDAENITEKAFTNVVLASFTRTTEQAQVEAGGATYQITLSFNPSIFDITKTVKLLVPNKVTTRSVTERPQDLFKPSENNEVEGR